MSDQRIAPTPQFLELPLKGLEGLPEETVRVPQKPRFFYTSASMELTGSKSPREALSFGPPLLARSRMEMLFLQAVFLLSVV